MSVQYCDETVERCRRMVYSAAWHYTSDKGVWDDLVQEGMIGLGDACRDYDESRGRFSSYAWMKITDRIRKYTQYKTNTIHVPVEAEVHIRMVTLPAYEETSPTIVPNYADAIDINDALAILDDESAALVRAVFLDGCTIKEVSEAHGLEYETCRYRVRCAVDKMREWMDQ